MIKTKLNVLTCTWCSGSLGRLELQNWWNDKQRAACFVAEHEWRSAWKGPSTGLKLLCEWKGIKSKLEKTKNVFVCLQTCSHTWTNVAGVLFEVGDRRNWNAPVRYWTPKVLQMQGKQRLVKESSVWHCEEAKAYRAHQIAPKLGAFELLNRLFGKGRHFGRRLRVEYEMRKMRRGWRCKLFFV